MSLTPGAITLPILSAIPPAPPASGKYFFYFRSSSLKYMDSTGTEFTISTGITAEDVQDIIGNILTDSSTIDFTYNDAGDAISAAVIAGGVNHNALLNYVSNQHIDHSTVSISAGSGLTGGGDITATRTISMPAVGTSGTYKSVTTDAQGRVSAGTNPTTLAGFGITDAQPLDGDLTSIANLAGTGLVTRTATNTMTTRAIVAGSGMSVSNGDGVSGSPTVSLANTAVVAGSYGSVIAVPTVTVDAQGRITGASTGATITPTAIGAQPADSDLDGISALSTTGIMVRTGPGTYATRFIAISTGLSGVQVDGVSGNPTLSIGNTGVSPATYGSATQVPVIAINSQGQATIASNLSIAIVASQVTNFAATVLATVLTGFSNAAGTIVATDTILQGFAKLQGTITDGLASFASDVRSVVLTGYTVGANAIVVATDTILQAIGKLQGQIDALVAIDNTWNELITTADIIVSSSVTLTNVPDLGFSAVAGRKYYLEYTIMFRCAATTTGFSVSLGTPDTAVGTIAAFVNMPIAADGTAAGYTGSITSFGDVVVGTGVQTAQPTWFICNVKGIFSCTTSGTFLPQFRSEVNGSNVNFGAGSVALIREFS